ncbi:MAG: dTDP-4-dehydrorhamnose reductase [Bermanella sp.]
MRGRVYREVTPDQLLDLKADDLAGSLVLEVATLTALQSGNVLSIGGDARHHLVELAERVGCPFLFLSDGRVFDGNEAPLNHRETEKTQPGSLAGGRLSAVEHLLERHIEKHLVLRTGPIFSEQGKNFFTSLFSRLVAGGEIPLNSSLKTCPTHVLDLARVVSALIDQIACGAQNWGPYHYSSSGQTSAYEFTEVMLAFASQHLNLSKVKTSLCVLDSGVLIDPAVPVLRVEKILHHFGIKQLPWRAQLPEPIKQLCERKEKGKKK